MKQSDIPYRIAVVETLLRAASLPDGVQVVIKPLSLRLEEERRLFPRFSVDRHFISIRAREISYSITGILEWGVFWYRLDKGEPHSPESEALLWGTIDRLPSVVKNVTNRLIGSPDENEA
jgi:hypothetical protein